VGGWALWVWAVWGWDVGVWEVLEGVRAWTRARAAVGGWGGRDVSRGWGGVGEGVGRKRGKGAYAGAEGGEVGEDV